MIISVLTRRLREGKDYADFRAAWLPDQGFLARVGLQEKLRHDRIAEVVEPGGASLVYLQVADDDLSDTPPAE